MSTLFGKSSKRRAKRKVEDVHDDEEEVVEQPKTKLASLDANSEKPTSDLVHVHNTSSLSSWSTFDDIGLAEPLVKTCRSLGFQRPSPVQRAVVPFLLQEESAHVLALAATGSGKTAAFCLPILHHLAKDPYGIYAAIISPTRELAKQIHQQVLALGSAYQIQSALVVGGLDAVKQACELDRKPHFVVATPGRLAELLRGPNPPRLKHIRYLVLDEADRLLASNSGFERDVAELVLHCNQDKRTKCQTLLFSATMTGSLESLESIAGTGKGRLPLHKFVITEDTNTSNTSQASESAKSVKTELAGLDCGSTTAPDQNYAPNIPAGLRQEYIFMPSRVRDAYLLATIRTLMSNGGRPKDENGKAAWSGARKKKTEDDDASEALKARSTIIFVSTCERAALISGILSQVGVDNVALHSLLSQNRRLAALGKFKSQQVRVLVATDVASRGLDIPSVDLVLNSELPRNTVSYVHRVGRTARAGRRGRAISLVSETDINLVHAAERITGRPLEKCTEITDEAAIKMLGPVTKAARLAKMHLMDIGFDELVKKFKERKVRDRKDRQRIEKALQRSAKNSKPADM